MTADPIGTVPLFPTTIIKVMYILANGENILRFPYTLRDLYLDNPNVSFVKNMSTEELEEWGVFQVEEQTPPTINDATESLEQGTPILVDGKWKQTWTVTTASVEEIEQRRTTQMKLIRSQRGLLLDQTDFTQIPDYPASDAEHNFWINYRQALRDIPLQSGFPWQVEWPEFPSEDNF